jgi:hypothetical protein
VHLTNSVCEQRCRRFKRRHLLLRAILLAEPPLNVLVSGY